MGQLNSPESLNSNDSSQPAHEVLKTVTHDLRVLQQDLVAHFGQDLKRLQIEKNHLLHDIERLREEHQALQTEHQALLSQRQLAQQQLWAKQLAQTLASHLHTLLTQQLSQASGSHATTTALKLTAPDSQEQATATAYQVISTLDSSLQQTLNTLKQELTSYQSALSQQLNRMQTMEQQGEAILEALVSRLGEQLQHEIAQPPAAIQDRQDFRNEAIAPPKTALPPIAKADHPAQTTPPTPVASVPSAYQSPYPTKTNPAKTSPVSPANHPAAPASYPPAAQPPYPKAGSTLLPIPPATAPDPAVAPVRSVMRPWGLSQFWTGFWLIMASTIALSCHNVAVRVLGSPSSLFGIVNVGGYVSLTSLGNSLLILFMRMLVVAPGMALLASFLYPTVWRDIKLFLRSQDRRLLVTVVGSGCCLFFSQVLIYIAFGEFSNPGIPVTILFMYPLITVPMAWLLFGDRPSRLRWAVMATILFGVILTATPSLASAAKFSVLGVTTAIASGFAFAFYLISMQSSFRKLHPVPVSVIQFTTIFFLTCLILLLRPPAQIQSGGLVGFIVGACILGTLTLLGYLLNNFGVRFMGAAQASIIASTGPVITALLASLIIGAKLTSLQGIGIFIVTVGVVALDVEKLLIQRKALRSPKRS
jgi:drug/metabolite transporter (DMT)-like permease